MYETKISHNEKKSNGNPFAKCHILPNRRKKNLIMIHLHHLAVNMGLFLMEL